MFYSVVSGSYIHHWVNLLYQRWSLTVQMIRRCIWSWELTASRAGNTRVFLVDCDVKTPSDISTPATPRQTTNHAFSLPDKFPKSPSWVAVADTETGGSCQRESCRYMERIRRGTGWRMEGMYSLLLCLGTYSHMIQIRTGCLYLERNRLTGSSLKNCH